MEYDNISSIFYEVLSDLNLIYYDYTFNELVKEYDYKITFNYSHLSLKTYPTFSHPSYREGIIASYNYDDMNKLLFDVIGILLNNDDPLVRGLCGLCLTKNYDYIKDKKKAQDIIYNLFKDKKVLTRYGSAHAAKENFKQLPMDLALDLLSRYSSDRHRDIRASVMEIIASNFDYLDQDIVLHYLEKGLNDRAARTRQAAVRVVRIHYQQLPKSMLINALKVNKELSSFSNWSIREAAWMVQDDMEKKFAPLVNE